MSRTFGTATPRVSSTSSRENSATADYVAISIAAGFAGVAALVGALWLATAGSATSSMAESWRAPVEIVCKATPAHIVAACPECSSVPWSSQPCRDANRHWLPKP